MASQGGTRACSVATLVMLLGTSLGLASGCVVFERPRDRAEAAVWARLHPTPPALPAELAAPFAIEPPVASALRLETVRGTARWERRVVTFRARRASDRQPATVTFEWYAVRHAPAPRPLVLVMPILGGSYPAARYLCAMFAEHGWHAAFVHRQGGGDEAIAGTESPEELDAALRDTIVACRRALAVLRARPEIDGDRVGLVGMSLGAIAGSILLALEPTIAAGVLLMGGGDMAGLIATSRESPVRALRRNWLERYGLQHPQALAARMRARLPRDPLRYAPYVGPGRVLQLISTWDRRILPRYQWRLWESLGRPQAAAMPIGHYSAIVYLGYAREAMFRFLERRLRRRARPTEQAPPTRQRAPRPQRLTAAALFPYDRQHPNLLGAHSL